MVFFTLWLQRKNKNLLLNKFCSISKTPKNRNISHNLNCNDDFLLHSFLHVWWNWNHFSMTATDIHFETTDPQFGQSPKFPLLVWWYSTPKKYCCYSLVVTILDTNPRSHTDIHNISNRSIRIIQARKAANSATLGGIILARVQLILLIYRNCWYCSSRFCYNAENLINRSKKIGALIGNFILVIKKIQECRIRTSALHWPTVMIRP
jgi:hypothetical protein